MARVTDISEAKGKVEVALYSAGRPLRIEELIRASGTESRTRTQEILDSIIKGMKATFSGLELAVLPDGSYVFQSKPEFGTVVKRYASRPVLPNATLKTLSYIAMEQPLSGKVLVETRGTGVYAHLKELRQLDLVRFEKVGNLKIYNTTEKFKKFFGIKGDVDDLKQRLMEQVKRTARRTSARKDAPSRGGADKEKGGVEAVSIN